MINSMLKRMQKDTRNPTASSHIHMVSGTMCTNNLINTALRIHNHLIDTVIDKIKEELK